MAEIRHFLDLWKLDGATIRALLDEAARRKPALAGRRAGWTPTRQRETAPWR
jgi:ornithine carbamoyltransferase